MARVFLLPEQWFSTSHRWLWSFLDLHHLPMQQLRRSLGRIRKQLLNMMRLHFAVTSITEFHSQTISASNALLAPTTSIGCRICCSKARTKQAMCWVIIPSKAPILDSLNSCPINLRLWECSYASLFSCQLLWKGVDDYDGAHVIENKAGWSSWTNWP
jgi:hypothetical protein